MAMGPSSPSGNHEVHVSTASPASRTPLRILHVLYFATPYTSGLTLYVERLARRQVRLGDSVTILSARYDPDLPEREVIDGATVLRLPVRLSFSRAVIVPSLVPRAAQLLREHDVLHIHLPVAEAAALAALGRAMRKRVIVTHNSDLDISDTFLETLASKVALGSSIVGGRLAHRTMTYTHDRGRVSPLVRRLGNNVSVVGPPIEIPEPSPGARDAFRARHGLGHGPIIGFSGRMAPEKGLSVLGRTIPLVRARWPGAHYALAGPLAGPDGVIVRGPWDDLFEQHPGAVTKVGTLGMQDLADFYAACDVLVLPSTNWTETFGMVQPEAMLCGTPCIASNLPGVREPVRRTGMGLVAEVGDHEDLAAKIIEVIANRDAYVRPADDIRALYSTETTAATYDRLYRGEIGEPLQR
jgi:glycosyltransferase involved in cell wall biosynthesis